MSGILVPRRGREVWKDYNEINPADSASIRLAKLEMWIARAIGQTLVQHYPDREWGVRVDATGRMIILTCDSLSLLCGYHLPMNDDTLEVLQQRAVRACGEVLERYNISRSRVFNPDDLETLARDARDEAISPDAAPTPITHKG